jgi:5-methylcytosine-specific restriction endonuclease McrA
MCKRCQQAKNIDDFQQTSGVSINVCKACVSARRKEIRQADPERFREQNRKGHARGSAKFAAKAREWKREHPERNRELKRLSAQRHPEETRARLLRWRESTPDYRASIRAWEAAHPEEAKASRTVAKARFRSRLREAVGDFTVAEWLELRARYGNRCLACGRSEPEILLTPDHVVPLGRGGANDISNIQLLCLPCNLRKHVKHIDYRSA